MCRDPSVPQFDEDDDEMYENVTEEQYEKLVRKRQREDFVVDDGEPAR